MQLLKHFKELTVHPKNADQLKGLILQLAIQGKLTEKWREQHPNVEPASILLEKIQEEKAQLIKEKKIKKEKALPEIGEDEIPFELPNEWKWERLANISAINGGFAFKSSQYVDEGVRVIRISDFDEKGFKDKKIVRYNYNSDLADYRLEKKNILMAMTGGTVGKTLYVDTLEEEMVVNQRVATIKLIPLISEEYINCVIQTRLIKNVVDEAKNSTNDNISMGNIKNFFMPIPPLEEQKAIIDIVNQLFREVEALEEQTKARVRLKEDFVTSALQQLTTGDTTAQWSFLQDYFKIFFTEKTGVKKLRESILQLAVQGKLTHHWRSENPVQETAEALLEKIKAEKAQLIKDKKIKKEKPLPEITEDEIPYDLPDGWTWCRIDKIADNKKNALKAGPFGSALKKEFYVESGYKIYGQEQVIAGDPTIGDYYIDEDRFQSLKSCEVQSGDILISLVGTVGKVLILPNDIEPGIINPRLIKVSLHNEIDREFFKMFLYSPFVRSFIDDNSQGSTMNIINLKILKQIIIPLPPLEEQKAIVAKVNSLMDLCDNLEQHIEHSTTQVEQLMQSCLKEVFEH